MITYFPRVLREDHLRRVAEEIFRGRLRIKPRLRKGVWPHLVRVFHPGMVTREERESYLGKLRLIYDALKGRIQSQADSPGHQNRQHLYDSIRRDAMRTDPTESFYNNGRRNDRGASTRDGSMSASSSIEASYLSRENIEKLVNITAVYTIEHEEVSYTQGMTDLLSPILYVMEREDDAYVVFSAMVQRIAENFGTWCEGTLKKVERLRHLCSVLDPELSAYLKDIEEDAFALFFGMVLIECRREFSFDSSFHLMEVIWSAALCMQQREDPNWSPPSTPPATTRKDHRRIQALSPDPPSLSSPLPSHSEWASFMSDRSPDVIRQVFGDLQTYTAVPLPRSECGSISRAPFQISYSPPPQHRRSSVTAPTEREKISEEGDRRRERGEICAATTTICAEVYNNETSETAPKVVQNGQNRQIFQAGAGGMRERGEGGNQRTHHQRQSEDGEEEEVGATPKVSVAPPTERPQFAYSPGKDRSLSDPVRHRVNQRVHPSDDNPNTSSVYETETKRSTPAGNPAFASGEQEGKSDHSNVTHPDPKLRRSCSASDLSPSPPPTSPPPVKLATRTQTEMSDMSSVESAIASGGAGGGGGGEAAGNERITFADDVGSEGHRTEDEREGEDEGERKRRRKGLRSALENAGTRTPPNVDTQEDFTITAGDTPRHSAPTDDSPSIHGETDSTLRERSFTHDIIEYPPVSPVRPFFDALETIASFSRPNSPAPAATGGGDPSRPSSSTAAVFTNLLSMELSAPAVTRESSLTVPFSDSFPLFICLSIIIQHRGRILEGNLDFVGLSVLLNTQAGTQNLDRTLRIARQLYERYRGYQRLCFGPRYSVYEVWLDNMDSLFSSPSLAHPATANTTPHQNGSTWQRVWEEEEDS